MSGTGHRLLVDAWDSLRSRPGRTLLAVAGVSIGMGALTVLVALLGGLQERARLLVSDLGGDVLAIVQGGGHPASGLTPAHAEALRGALPGGQVAVVWRTRASTLGTDAAMTVLGADEHLARVRGWEAVAGRMLDAEDQARGERHVVVSESLARDWQWKVGDTIRLGKTLFQVVGVAAMGGAPAAAHGLGPRAVMVPRSVAAMWADTRRSPAGRPDALFVRVPEGRTVEWAEQRARRVLSAPDLAASDLTFVTPRTVLAGVRRLQRGVTLSAGGIALLALVLGGTTLMSLLTAGVLERVPEIGLRRALGGRPRDVAALFVVEACVVTSVAGVVGVAAALALLPALGGILPVPVRIGPITVLLPLVFSLLAGVVFSWWPARSAARIPPSEALRAG